MPESRKVPKILRCPYCLFKENDVVLHKKANGSYYCIKCSFTGKYDEIKKNYDILKQKFTNRCKRITLEDIEKM